VLGRGRKAFIPFVTAGHPDLETTLEIVVNLARVGAAVVEIGIPFSDPVADGPIIQKSSFAALRHGYGISDYIELVRRIRSRTEVGLIFMTYLNPVFRYGLRQLDHDASEAGLDGILISDLTPEEYLLMSGQEDISCSEEREEDRLFQKLDTVFLAAPTSSEERLRLISHVSTGFVYVIARTGVTGTKTQIDDTLVQPIERIRAFTDLPVAVGFGIRSRSDVERVWQYADAAIVGSAIVQFVDAHQSSADLPAEVAEYTRSELIPNV